MPAPTIRLHHDDPLLWEFQGTVLAHAVFQGRQSVVLDRSVFYPESGGQQGDTGRLGGARVADVQVDDAGVVHHLLEGDPPALGTVVTGQIDGARRRIHMAQHTAQHMLSAALLEGAGGETVSSRLGEGACTIDLDLETLADKDVVAAEDRVNALIDEDLVIRAYFPSEEVLRALPLRRRPKVSENIRVVQIGDFDVSPCGGTHCTRTAQVGLVRVTGVERYKGKARVTFQAGRRAREGLWAEARALRGLAAVFTCGPLEVPASVDSMRHALAETRTALGAARAVVAGAEAERLLAEARAAGRTVVVGLVDGDAELLRAMARKLTAQADVSLVLGARGPEGIAVMCTRGERGTLDCGAAMKELAAAGGGRGGGKPAHAEGRLPLTADFSALAARLLAR
ncbi:MAG: alanyl-tRNA editing protein [Deltaproteobacteria bacterium]|nr:alanyl-tRNA editing protein [Deltaproteobacteria bacterium]